MGKQNKYITLKNTSLGKKNALFMCLLIEFSSEQIKS